MSSKKTLTEDVIRLRTLMNIPVNEDVVIEEGWGANLATGTMLTLATLLPGMVQTASAQSPDGGKTEQVSTRQPVDSNRLNQILKTLKSQGWMSESNMHDLFKYIDHLPSGSWGIADGEGKTSILAKRNVDIILNTMDKSRIPHNSASDLGQGGMWQPRLDAEKKAEDVPRFTIFKQKPNGTWEAMGFVLMDRTANISPEPETQLSTPEATATQNVQELQFESINRQRALMGLPLLKEGLEEEGFGRNLVAGVGLAIMSLLPGLASAQNAVPSADGAKTEQAATNKPIDEAQLEQVLMRLKDQGFIPKEGWGMVSQTLDANPHSMWIVVDSKSDDYGFKVEMQAERSVNALLNSMESGSRPAIPPADALAGKTNAPKAPRIVLTKHTGAIEAGAPPSQRRLGYFESIGIMAVPSNTASFPTQQIAPEVPQTPNTSGL